MEKYDELSKSDVRFFKAIFIFLFLVVLVNYIIPGILFLLLKVLILAIFILLIVAYIQAQRKIEEKALIKEHEFLSNWNVFSQTERRGEKIFLKIKLEIPTENINPLIRIYNQLTGNLRYRDKNLICTKKEEEGWWKSLYLEVEIKPNEPLLVITEIYSYIPGFGNPYAELKGKETQKINPQDNQTVILDFFI